MSFGKYELSLWTMLFKSKGFSKSKCAYISVAWTPVSVRPAPIRLISEFKITETALFRVSCTDEALGWHCHPWYWVPLYASFIKYLKFRFQISGFKFQIIPKETRFIFWKANLQRFKLIMLLKFSQNWHERQRTDKVNLKSLIFHLKQQGICF